MTMALCLNCGEIKFGAFCTCDVCKADATGDENLDILFSDWSHELEMLEHFGRVIKEIHSHCTNSEICFWAFMLYVSAKDPELFTITIKHEVKQEAERGCKKYCVNGHRGLEVRDPIGGLTWPLLKTCLTS